jgi:UDP-N-acetylglucosamine:LPS N-acetylglucosamine transferase
MGQYKFILSGGGTGGHIYPAIAIAYELKFRFLMLNFFFVGSKDGMECKNCKPVFKLGVCGLLVYKAKFTKFDVSFKWR